MTIQADIQKLEPGSRVELFELDARSIGAGRLFFHADLRSGPIYWQGRQHDPWPITASGFELTSEQPPTPRLEVGKGKEWWIITEAG